MNEKAIARGFVTLDDLDELLESLWPRFLARHIHDAAYATLAFELGGVAEVFPNFKYLWRSDYKRSVTCL